MEKWLADLIDELRQTSEKELSANVKQPQNIRLKIESGQENIADVNFDVNGLIENVFIPTQLLIRGFEGLEKTLQSLNMPLMKDYRVRGFSESEYSIPYYLEDEKRLVLFEPLYLSGTMEALGLNEVAYSLFSPLFAMEFFKYVDIMNASTKPTIMAFFELTNLKEVSDVNFFEFFKRMIDPSANKQVTDSQTKKEVFQFLPRNIFNAYGIPNFKVPLVDGLRISRYDPQQQIEQKKITAYATSMGIYGFLNPSVVDYALYATCVTGKTNAKTVGALLNGGDHLGHSPVKSNLLPDTDPIDVMNDPLLLLKDLKQQGMATEMAGKYSLTPNGLKLVEAEVKGKPKEATLTKVYNVVKKAEDVIPFFKFK